MEPRRERRIEAAANVVEFTFAAGAIQPMNGFLQTTSAFTPSPAELPCPAGLKSFGTRNLPGARP